MFQGSVTQMNQADECKCSNLPPALEKVFVFLPLKSGEGKQGRKERFLKIGLLGLFIITIAISKCSAQTNF